MTREGRNCKASSIANGRVYSVAALILQSAQSFSLPKFVAFCARFSANFILRDGGISVLGRGRFMAMSI
jgi:hypothetical protein